LSEHGARRCERMSKAPIVKQVEAAAGDVVRHRKALADALERRDKRVLEASDQGIPVRAIGRAANLSVGGVMRILATPYSWTDELADAAGSPE
jgi:hypothetical protein